MTIRSAPALSDADIYALQSHSNLIAFCDQGRRAAIMESMVDSVWSSGYAAVVKAVVDMREEAGLTQRELAERIGREQSFVGRIETRERRIDLVEFVRICRCCGLDGEKELAKVTKQVLELIPKKPIKSSK